MKKTLRLLIPTVASLLAFLGPPSGFGQGALNPPGAPAPTMKKLDEVEPRTNLQATPAPAGVDTTNANFHFIINQPGSYYLSGNLGVTKANGIQITAEGVTLDLNGFQISRAGGSGGDGIQISQTAHRTTLVNGSLKGFAVGVNTPGTSNGARACRFRDLSVSGCTTSGISSGPGAVLESCRVHDSSGTSGIFCSFGSTLRDCTAMTNTVIIAIWAEVGSTLINCTASSNTAALGIYADSGSSLTNCNAIVNGSSADHSSGIATGSGCTITACTAYSNYSSAGTFTAATGIGFDVGSGNTIQGCTAGNNRGDGIRLSGSSLARENNCTSNGASGDGAGIHALSPGNRIEGNNVAGNDRGIDVDAAGNVIVKNTARQNAPNYDIAANNVFGAIVDRTAPAWPAVSGNSSISSAITTDPLANISY